VATVLSGRSTPRGDSIWWTRQALASIGVIEAEFEDLIGTAVGCGEAIDADLALAFIGAVERAIARRDIGAQQAW
jgi:hypothetical protein